MVSDEPQNDTGSETRFNLCISMNLEDVVRCVYGSCPEMNTAQCNRRRFKSSENVVGDWG